MSLYEGFRYFFQSGDLTRGVIAYVETQFGWVAAGEPICKPELSVTFLVAFQLEARRQGKTISVLPVSQEFAALIRQEGFKSCYIGSEPWHILNPSLRSPSDLIKHLNPARQLNAKGARVEEVNFAKISNEDSLELQKISRNWLETRKSDPLGFLNRLEPWTLSEHKKYFWIKYDGKIQGFWRRSPSGQRKAGI